MPRSINIGTELLALCRSPASEHPPSLHDRMELEGYVTTALGNPGPIYVCKG